MKRSRATAHVAQGSPDPDDAPVYDLHLWREGEVWCAMLKPRYQDSAAMQYFWSLEFLVEDLKNRIEDSPK